MTEVSGARIDEETTRYLLSESHTRLYTIFIHLQLAAGGSGGAESAVDISRARRAIQIARTHIAAAQARRAPSGPRLQVVKIAPTASRGDNG